MEDYQAQNKRNVIEYEFVRKSAKTLLSLRKFGIKTKRQAYTF